MKISVKKITYIGILAAFSLVIFLVEAQFPVFSVPGIKLGLSNVVVMAAMIFVGRREAGCVLLVRIILSAAICGTFISFMFSFAGGLLSYIAMCLLLNRFDKHSLWVVSAFGGLFHIVGQLIVVAFMFGLSTVVSLFPVLIISGILAGSLNGLIIQRLWFSPLKKFSIR